MNGAATMKTRKQKDVDQKMSSARRKALRERKEITRIVRSGSTIIQQIYDEWITLIARGECIHESGTKPYADHNLVRDFRHLRVAMLAVKRFVTMLEEGLIEFMLIFCDNFLERAPLPS